MAPAWLGKTPQNMRLYDRVPGTSMTSSLPREIPRDVSARMPKAVSRTSPAGSMRRARGMPSPSKGAQGGVDLSIACGDALLAVALESRKIRSPVREAEYVPPYRYSSPSPSPSPTRSSRRSRAAIGLSERSPSPNSFSSTTNRTTPPSSRRSASPTQRLTYQQNRARSPVRYSPTPSGRFSPTSSGRFSPAPSGSPPSWWDGTPRSTHSHLDSSPRALKAPLPHFTKLPPRGEREREEELQLAESRVREIEALKPTSRQQENASQRVRCRLHARSRNLQRPRSRLQLDGGSHGGRHPTKHSLSQRRPPPLLLLLQQP